MYCQSCDKKSNCAKVCKRVSSHLKSLGIFSADYIRPRMPSDERENGVWREIPLSTFKGKEIEKLK